MIWTNFRKVAATGVIALFAANLGGQQGNQGGATSANGTPQAPGSSGNAGQTNTNNKQQTGNAGNSTDAPADRDWKLANQLVAVLPAADADLMKLAPPYLGFKDAHSLVEHLRGFDLTAAITAAFPQASASDRTNCTDPKEPWILQAAVYDTKKDDAKPVRVDTYMYDPSRLPTAQKDLQRVRIYGSQKACFVLLAYVNGATELGDDGADFTKIAGGFVKKTHLAIAQFYAAKAKTPAPLQDLKDLISLAVGAQAGGANKTATKPMWVFGMTEIDSLPVPSDMWLQVGAPGSEINPTDFSPYRPEVQFDNEGYYWYDFTVAMPLNKVDALEYNEGDNIVQTKQTDLKTVYATGNLFLHHADIKDPSTLWVPRLLFGIGIRGKPFDRTFVGAGFGLGFLHWAPLNVVQPFAGLSFNRIYQTQGTGTSAVLEGRTVHKLVVGINIPVKSVVDRLKNATDTSSSSSKTPSGTAGASGSSGKKKTGS